MRALLLFTVWALAAQAGGVSLPDTWTKRTKPFRVIDNVYYVGTTDLASYLITSADGHVLIDTGLEQNAPAVMSAIRQLGFQVKDIEIILTTQAHFDHVGAHSRLAAESGARVLASAEDAPVLRDGGKGDYHFGADYYFPKVRVDGEIHEGQVVTMGSTVLTARLTPGHSKGTTTWTMMAHDRNGRMQHVVFMGSTAVNDGVRLVDNRDYPMIASDYRRSFRVLQRLPCDVFLAGHASAFDGMAKAAAALGGKGEGAFIDPGGCRAAVVRSEKAFEAILEQQRTAAIRRDSAHALPRPSRRPRHAERVERPVVVAPVGIDLHSQIEKDLGVEEAFEVVTRLGANPLEHLAAAPDDDRLL
jgi:metallo-beta-lactamase class B